jgi:hypothetical protein
MAGRAVGVGVTSALAAWGDTSTDDPASYLPSPAWEPAAPAAPEPLPTVLPDAWSGAGPQPSGWPLETLSLAEAQLRYGEPPADLVEGLWSQHLTVVVGQPYVGKTFLVLHLAKAYITGRPLLGRAVAVPHDRPTVCYVGTDDGAAEEVTERATLLGVPSDRFYVATWAGVPADAQVDQQARIWRERGVTAVILDNLSGMVGAADINSNKEMAPALDLLKRLSQHGLHVLLVHHAAKPGYKGEGGGKTPMGTQTINARVRRTVLVEAASGTAVKITVMSNGSAAHEPMVAELRGAEAVLSDQPASRREPRDRNVDKKAADARTLLAGATHAELANRSKAGAAAHRLDLSSSPGGGVKLVGRLIESRHLATDVKGRVIAGAKLSDIPRDNGRTDPPL